MVSCEKYFGERVVTRLREQLAFNTDDMSDQELLAMTKGTYFRACVELGLECENLGVCIRNEIDKTRTKMNNAIGRHLKRILNR